MIAFWAKSIESLLLAIVVLQHSTAILNKSFDILRSSSSVSDIMESLQDQLNVEDVHQLADRLRYVFKHSQMVQWRNLVLCLLFAVLSHCGNNCHYSQIIDPCRNILHEEKNLLLEDIAFLQVHAKAFKTWNLVSLSISGWTSIIKYDIWNVEFLIWRIAFCW